jgi:hypothetical protein
MDWVLLLGRILFRRRVHLVGPRLHPRRREMAMGYTPDEGAAGARARVIGTGALVLFHLFQQFGDSIGLTIEPSFFG